MKVAEEVATHVLIPMTIAEELRDLSRKTRVRQSEYLREAVQDLLKKYEGHADDEAGVAPDGSATD